MAALYLYDRCITIGTEINFIWRRRYSVASILYATLQVSTISVLILYTVQQMVSLSCDVRFFDMIPWPCRLMSCLLAGVIHASKVWHIQD